MVSVDARFVIDCVRGLPSAVERYRTLRDALEPLHLSVVARAAVITDAADRDATFQHKAADMIRATESLDLDAESIRCAADIARELAREGRRLDGVDLFVAAGARRHGQVLVSANPSFEHVAGLVREPY